MEVEDEGDRDGFDRLSGGMRGFVLQFTVIIMSMSTSGSCVSDSCHLSEIPMFRPYRMYCTIRAVSKMRTRLNGQHKLDG